MGHESNKVYEIVERGVSHTWSIPEFQRGFVWTSTQTRDLAESLWLNYPIGSLLIWESGKPMVPRLATDAQVPSLWVVDGQQRTTALCVLFGRKPYWWSSNAEWEAVLKKYDIRFDINAKEPPFFWVANAVIRNTKEMRYILLRDLLNLDSGRDQDVDKMRATAKAVKKDGLCEGMDELEVYTRLDRVRNIREREVVTITVNHELEDVVEIFSRLNSKGTRVTEADIYLGVVAARTPGWVHDTFLPYLKKLREAGFDIDPNLLFRCITGIGAKKVRFREIKDDFWDTVGLNSSTYGAGVWPRTTAAWEHLIFRFRE